MNRPVRTHTFRGVRYEIIRGQDVDGFVHIEGEPEPLFLQSGLSPPRHMETCIHEALHAIEPRMTEGRVNGISSDLARWLWRLGYRLTR